MNQSIFLFQAAATTVAYLWIYAWFVAPAFRRWSAADVFTALLVPNLFRHIGFATLSTQTVQSELAQQIGMPEAIGDVALLVITYIGLWALRRGWRSARALCWAFVAVGMVHNVAVGYAMVTAPFPVFDRIGAHWYVGTFVVPLVVLTEFIMFVQLLKRGAELPPAGNTRRPEPPGHSYERV